MEKRIFVAVLVSIGLLWLWAAIGLGLAIALAALPVALGAGTMTASLVPAVVIIGGAVILWRRGTGQGAAPTLALIALAVFSTAFSALLPTLDGPCRHG